ncbi:glycosyltransferase family 32 protein [Bacteroides thetaiotaomicron]|uniref:glycosyltransferase family 32 protein n=1 Tax=Bacteroides thetaiotaomicron TaxID=818 RepID=UPI001CE350C2|nr:glycosyltransferase [Bacteroides thetaiotaomicron]MCA6034472.1 glycosyl transferase [Bacteroides thetaiotaomicron]
MIPKVIHYCWFGGNPLPELAQKCITSWKKLCPDYKIKEWNEQNFDVYSNAYVREAYEARKFAFVSDYVRLYALYTEGGVYMDTDVEVLKNLDVLLHYEAVSGFESKTQIPTGLIASQRLHPFIGELLHEYDELHFQHPNGSLDMTTNVVRITNTCLKYGFCPNNTLQTIKGFTLLPKDYLCPIEQIGHRLIVTENTLTIHHFAGSWTNKSIKMKKKISKIIGYKFTLLIIGIKAWMKKNI